MGAYTIYESDASPEVILIGTGTELHLASQAAEELAAKGKKVRCVSMPCWELFEKQSAEYKASVFPAGVPTVSIEAASTFGWAKYATIAIGHDDFGSSASAPLLYEKFGITQAKMVEAAESLC